MESLISVITERCSAIGNVVVALSGGVDSTLVAAAAYQVLGKRCVAVTVQSELTAERDFTRAVEMAEFIGVEHHPLCMRMLDNKRVRRNTKERCYYCKKAIFELMVYEYGDQCLIMDGTNGDDDPARPGLKAIKEFGVFSPLKEAGLTKTDVRETARSSGLPNWNAPSESCLATRLPVGMPLSLDRLNKIQVMESFYHSVGVESLRVRHDNLVATVEYVPQYTDIIRKEHDNFTALIKEIGLLSCVYKEYGQ